MTGIILGKVCLEILSVNTENYNRQNVDGGVICEYL